MSSTNVHPTAIVHKGAEIGPGSVVGPYSIIGSNVRVGANNIIGPHVVIEGNTQIGDGNKIYQFASVGSDPQDLKFKGEKNSLIIGAGNLIREYVTIQPGTEFGGLVTRIGDRNLFMVMSHIGHDGQIGSDNVFANSCALAGHVTVGSGAILGAMSGIHQFVRVGDGSLISGGSMVVKDIPPFCLAQGDRCGLAGINKIGLQRKGYSSKDIMQLRKLYREMFNGVGKVKEKAGLLRVQHADLSLAVAFLDFFETSERGVTQPRRELKDQGDDE